MRFVAQSSAETRLSISTKAPCAGFIAFCSATPRLRLWLFQYPGCFARHCRTRSTFHSSRQKSRFSGFWRQHAKLAAWRARLHFGLRQYR